MTTLRRALFGLLMPIYLLLPTLAAANERNVSESWTASFMFENDLFGDSDQSYTNGIKISWVSPDLTDYR
ncbi:MAG: lipid A-modifier LpxR family protein, partial [Haliea sp.]